MQYKINNGRPTQPIKVEVIEDLKKAKYVGDFCIKGKSGNWSETAVSVFYQAEPPNGYSNYFGLYYDSFRDSFYICDASSAFSEPITGIVGSDGEVVYSRYRHDFRSLQDGSGSIDGGRDYLKLTGGKDGKIPPTVSIKVDGPNLVVEEPDSSPTAPAV